MEKDRPVFRKELNSFDDWSRVFHDAGAVTKLCEHIFDREGLPFNGLQELEPGTNAVFRSGAYVIKVFVPQECCDHETDAGALETYMLRSAEKAGINVAPVIAQGTVLDRYSFSYLITGYVDGQMLRDCRNGMDENDKGKLVRTLYGYMTLLRDIMVPEGIKLRVLPHVSSKWTLFPESLSWEMSEIRGQVCWKDPCFVHGDLTGENIMIGGEKITLLDLGDVHYGPWFYELPSLFIEGLACDRELCTMMMELIGDPDFYRDMIQAIAIHDFGPELLDSLCSRTGTKVTELADTDKIISLMKGCWN